MSTRRTDTLAAPLKGLRRRFERWRRTRKVRTRIPDPLWDAAVKLAVRHGIHRTAKALRVDYYALKKRVAGTTAATAVIAGTQQESAATASRAAAEAEFLELPAAAWPGSGECTLELEDAVGAKLRVHLKGFQAPDLVALSQSFWQSEP